MIDRNQPMLVNTGSLDSPVQLSQAILEGYAPGNELYTFQEYPTVSKDDISALKGCSYSDIFYAVTKKLLGDTIPDNIQKSIAKDAYGRANFDFDDDDNLRFTTLPSGIHIVGLSDGPTGAFKDMAMQPFARWMSYLQGKKSEPLTIMLSTSGDTGPAALNAFAGLANTEIINMLPKHGVSRFQWAQMAEIDGQSGVHVLEVAGDFSYINNLHMKADLAYDLSSANSVNIARIIGQIPYYFASYIKVIGIEGKEIGDPVDVSVPSGNFGNALSAIIARKMGLPLRNIIVATNENNTLDTLFKDGVFELTEFVHTDSSAQDVKMPSNVWRYFAMLFSDNPEKIAQIYKRLISDGSIKINDIGVVDETVRTGVLSTTVNGKSRADTIKKIYKEYGVLIDPHTANGLAAIEQLQAHDPNVPMLSMETAKPFKFNEVMQGIVGIEPPRPDRFKGLEQKQKAKKLTQIINEVDLLAYLKAHTKAKAK